MEMAAPVDGEWRRNDIHARTVLEACIAHWAEFIDTAAYPGGDPLCDSRQVVDVSELDLDGAEFPVALDIDGVQSVDEDVADRRVTQQRSQGTEAPHLIDQAGCQVVMTAGDGGCFRSQFEPAQNRTDQIRSTQHG